MNVATSAQEKACLQLQTGSKLCEEYFKGSHPRGEKSAAKAGDASEETRRPTLEKIEKSPFGSSHP